VLGDLAGFGTGEVVAKQDSVALDPALLKKLAETEAKSTGGSKDTKRSGFKIKEYLLDIDNWKSIMTGGDAILFSYELPLLGAGFQKQVPLAKVPIGPIMMTIDMFAELKIYADLAFGFDTYGIRKAINTGNPLDALDGFFIFDFTLPEFKDGKIVPGTGGVEKDEFYISATLGMKLGIALGPLKGGGFGSINFYAGLDLQDIARSELTKDDRGYVTDVKWVSDGRIRGSEIATMFAYEGGGFLNLFNARMGATLSLGVFVELDLGLFTITFFEATLFKFNLFQLQYNAPRVQPYLATQVGDTLYLNAGDRAGLRKYFDVTDSDEEFILYGEGGEVSIEFDNWYQTYRGVNKVVANMGAGNDTLDASRLNGVTVDFRGGAGDDEILLGGGRMVNGTREGGSVRGGTGNDTITVAPGMLARYRLDGEEGDDKITGGLGDDTLVGGDGENRLTGTAGNNRYIIGAAKAAPVGSQQIRGGAGYETYEFLDNIGEVSFNDRQNGVALDFDALSDGIVVNVNKRVVSVTNELGQELRISGSTVDDIR